MVSSKMSYCVVRAVLQRRNENFLLGSHHLLILLFNKIASQAAPFGFKMTS
jgi:hypothetical protein